MDEKNADAALAQWIREGAKKVSKSGWLTYFLGVLCVGRGPEPIKLTAEMLTDPLEKLLHRFSYVHDVDPYELAFLEESAVEPLLEAAAKHPDQYMRGNAMALLYKMEQRERGLINRHGGVPALVEALNDPDDRVKRNAVYPLTIVGLKAIEHILRSKYINQWHATTFCFILENNPEEAVEEALKLAQKEETLREALEYIISKDSRGERGEKTIRPLEMLFDRGNEELKWRALVAISKVNSEKAIPVLERAGALIKNVVNLFAAADAGVKTKAKERLIELGGPALPHIVEEMALPSPARDYPGLLIEIIHKNPSAPQVKQIVVPLLEIYKKDPKRTGEIAPVLQEINKSAAAANGVVEQSKLPDDTRHLLSRRALDIAKKDRVSV